MSILSTYEAGVSAQGQWVDRVPSHFISGWSSLSGSTRGPVATARRPFSQVQRPGPSLTFRSA